MKFGYSRGGPTSNPSLQRTRLRSPLNSISLGHPEECHETHVDDHRGQRRAAELQMVPIAVWPALDSSSAFGFWSAPRLRRNCVALSSRVSRRNHPSLMSPDDGTPGNGLLLFFRVDDYGAALRRARALVPQLAEEPHVNLDTRTKEFSLRSE